MPAPGKLLENLADGRAKLHVIRAGLALRRRWPSLFQGGDYAALYADAGREENVCAFALRSGERCVIAVAPRLFARLMAPEDHAPLGGRVWGEARIGIGARLEGDFQDLLTGDRHRAAESGLRVSELLSRFPVALLVNA
jgi:(1->4)-alpha-D-glucan 1-alpha-D-glucosylmutase